MRTVSFTEARRDLSALLREVESGGEIVITRGGRPVARLVAGAPDLDPTGAQAAGMEAVRARLAAVPPVVPVITSADLVRADRDSH
ncbi:type II toxin-antitoxin system Phd/YefM family antitoxin [Phenylobacterium sp.]|jgi:prevent-host-death family protein|uniref:type II toxin-antitoxin system Phd/YefM family antitoxin n=1 Tax=Phenylobacterium sp. TaxID=1871053 RepID=UPI0037C66A5B